MLMYDWNKIYDDAKGNVDRIYQTFIVLTKGETIPKNKYDPAYRLSLINFKGNAFLAHPDVLLYHAFKYSKREIAQYLAVAAMRLVADYLTHGKTWVEYDAVPFDIETLRENRLLILDDENEIVRLKYEEVPEEKH